MRKKVLLFVLTLTSLAALAGTLAEAVGTTSCPGCITYPNGSVCCECRCDSRGQVLFCTDVFCPPIDGND